jgi:hypothetical protein
VTKPCKACKEEIDGAALKCPKCQAHQYWYRNPQWLSAIVIALFLAYSSWGLSSMRGRATFADYKDKFNVTILRDDQSERARDHLLTLQIENRSKHTWKRPKFEVQSLDGAGNVIAVEHISAYDVVLAPNALTKATISLRIAPAATVASRKVSLTDVDSSPY